jgi:uncharacterized protein (TIGR02145 family)
MRNIFKAVLLGILFGGCQKNDDGTVTVVPLPPIDLTATVISTTQVNLSWIDKSTNEDGFKIQRKTGGGNFADIGTVGKDVTNYSNNGLTPNTTYTYRVYAFNNVGASLTYTNEVTVTTNANVVLPTLTTSAISNITQASATGGGAITNDGGSPITARGIVWSTSSNPTVALTTKTSDGTGTGTFTSNLTGLTANTTYYVRAYATNSAGTSYGNQLSFTTSSGSGSTGDPFNPNLTYGTVTDQDNNTYKTIQIGTQTWMAENLRTTKYNDGSSIPLVSDNLQWAKNWNNGTNLQQLPMMCWYENDRSTNTANKFGALYNWFVVNPSTNGNKNVCPTGWHVPTDAEWTILMTFLGGEELAGGKMKSTGTQYWLTPNTGATNSSGFSGLPGGNRKYDGELFQSFALKGSWWSNTQSTTTNYGVWAREIYYNSTSAGRDVRNKAHGYSVRCLKD